MKPPPVELNIAGTTVSIDVDDEQFTLTTEDIARVCHESNRVLQALIAAPGIPYAGPWDDQPTALRQGVIAGVEGVLAGLSPEDSHDSWSATKFRQGWVYGDTKDEDAKTHPNLLPYDSLPLAEQRKDHLFRGVVLALAPLLADNVYGPDA